MIMGRVYILFIYVDILNKKRFDKIFSDRWKMMKEYNIYDYFLDVM